MPDTFLRSWERPYTFGVHIYSNTVADGWRELVYQRYYISYGLNCKSLHEPKKDKIWNVWKFPVQKTLLTPPQKKKINSLDWFPKINSYAKNRFSLISLTTKLWHWDLDNTKHTRMGCSRKIIAYRGLENSLLFSIIYPRTIRIFIPW